MNIFGKNIFIRYIEYLHNMLKDVITEQENNNNLPYNIKYYRKQYKRNNGWVGNTNP